VGHAISQNRYRLYHTMDGGLSWDFVLDNQTGPVVSIASGVAFTDETNGWFAVSQVGGAESPAPNWYVYHSNDAGQTWEPLNLPLPPIFLPTTFTLNPYWCGASAVTAKPALSIDLSFYCDVYEPDARPRYFFHFHSADGGRNWQAWEVPGGGGSAFLSPRKGWRLRPIDPVLSVLELTLDGGLHWGSLSTVGWAGSLDFIDSWNGWAVATSGTTTSLLHTQNAGRTWSEIKPVVAGP